MRQAPLRIAPGRLPAVPEAMCAAGSMGRQAMAAVEHQACTVAPRIHRRRLRPHPGVLEAGELYNAQDFPPTYIIDHTAAGKVLTKTAQVRMCGNSVSPLPMRKIVAANYVERVALRGAA